MPKVTLNNISNITGNPGSAAANINANFQAVSDQIDLLVSRDGEAVNTMVSDIDMNSNEILNLGSPTGLQSAARWADVVDSVDFTGIGAPSQSGNAGKYLQTNGTSGTWVYPYPRTTAEIAAGVTPVNYDYPSGYVYRYGANATPGTTDMTTALQAALDSSNVVKIPGETLAFSNLTIPVGRIIEGEGPRKSVLLQITGSTGNAMTFSDAASSDISEGGFYFSNFAMRVATGSHGLYMGAINASMFLSDNFRLVSRQAESLGSPPYTTTSGQRGIYVNNDGTGAIYFNTHRNLEIRSFDVGIDAVDTINEWSVHGWLLDCRVGIRLTDCSTWDLSGVSIETGVSNARALQTIGAVSNIKWHGGRWEITESGGYGIEGDGSTTGSNWRFSGINVLISGDGSAIPGRKWTGTLPNDVLFEGTDTVGAFMVHPNSGQSMRFPQRLLIGGQNLGNGRITIGRNLDTGALNILEHDGTHFVVTAGNSLYVKTGGTLDALRADDSTTAGHTRLLVYDVDNAAVERVTVGAADSGGVGFKVLRIPN